MQVVMHAEPNSLRVGPEMMLYENVSPHIRSSHQSSVSLMNDKYYVAVNSLNYRPNLNLISKKK